MQWTALLFYILCAELIISFANIMMFNSQLRTEVTDDPQTIQEMTEIAGSEDWFFKVSNYDSLENILSSLEKRIIRIEGKPQYL